MNDILVLAHFYLVSMCFGIYPFSPIADSKKTGGGFQKLLATVCAVCMFIALFIDYAFISKSISITVMMEILGLLTTLVNRQYFSMRDEQGAFSRVIYFVNIIAGIIFFISYQNYNAINILFVLSSALFLGVITYAMILGHWYLVTPKLSERPLIVSSYIIWLVMIPKIIWSGIEAYKAQSYLEFGTMLGGGYSFNWMMFLMRGIWGYLVIGVMSYFGWRLVKMRSIQSATGIFYSMTIFIFIGEIISSYLFFKFGLLI